MIARYVEQKEILAAPSKSKTKDLLKHHNEIRDSANALYAALESGWNCRCDCGHKANLQLQRRQQPHRSCSFSICLSYPGGSRANTQGQRLWLEAKVKIGKMDDASSLRVGRLSLEQASRNQDSSTSSPITPARNSPRIRIIEPEDRHQIPDTSLTPTVSNRRPQSQISSLCETLQSLQPLSENLGYLAYAPRRLCVDVDVSGSDKPDLPDPVPLGKLFPSGHEAHHFGKLSRQQRLSIAVTLAHAVLQFHQSPWMNEAWGKKDIFFFWHGVDTLKRSIIDHPYVSRSFTTHTNPNMEPVSPTHTVDMASALIVNKSLFALGIVLIELCFNKSFEELYAESRDTPTAPSEERLDSFEVYRVANSLTEAVYSEQGTQYGYVVQRCLRCEFGVQDSRKQLEIEAFRTLVYEGVLAPLEEDLARYNV